MALDDLHGKKKIHLYQVAPFEASVSAAGRVRPGGWMRSFFHVSDLVGSYCPAVRGMISVFSIGF